jgi:hypothetical protein
MIGQVGINKKLMVFNEWGTPRRPDCERVFVNPKVSSDFNIFWSHDICCDTRTDYYFCLCERVDCSPIL